MSTLLLQPSQQARAHQSFNKELFVDFTAAQVKTLSFVAFFVRPYHVGPNQSNSKYCKYIFWSYTTSYSFIGIA